MSDRICPDCGVKLCAVDGCRNSAVAAVGPKKPYDYCIGHARQIRVEAAR